MEEQISRINEQLDTDRIQQDGRPRENGMTDLRNVSTEFDRNVSSDNDKQRRHENRNYNLHQDTTNENSSRRMEGEKIKKKKSNGMKAIKRWFGEDTDSSDNSDSSDNNEDEWNNIERAKKNKEKKQRRKTLLKDKEMMTARKAQRMIGFSPIKYKSVEHYQENGYNYNDAKKMALREYLEYFLNFSQDELNGMTVHETMMSASGDETLYAAFWQHWGH